MSLGSHDKQTVVPGGGMAYKPTIDGVQIYELGNVITRSGWLTEIFRTDWPIVGITAAQVTWVQLNPGSVTDWHRHEKQTDHLVGVGGTIKLALWDGRDKSATRGASDVFRLGAVRPILVVIPPGVWHGLRNESGVSAGYLNVTDQLYAHHDPDNWRLVPGGADIPNIL
jgi:dTDP-4-dehydrorhamnose 3,5-epimerase